MKPNKNWTFNQHKFAIAENNVKGKVLSRSLLWMGLGLSMVILVAWLTATFDAFKSIMIFMVGPQWLVLFFIEIISMISISIAISRTKPNILLASILYIIFALINGIFISTIFFLTGVEQTFSQFALLLLIPAGVFVLMGIIGYFNLIDFSRLIPFAFFAFLGMMILSIVVVLTYSTTVFKWYLVLGMAVFVIWIGFDLQMIIRTEKSLEFNGYQIDKKTLNALAMNYGIKLFVDFINLFVIILRLFKSNN